MYIGSYMYFITYGGILIQRWVLIMYLFLFFFISNFFPTDWILTIPTIPTIPHLLLYNQINSKVVVNRYTNRGIVKGDSWNRGIV